MYKGFREYQELRARLAALYPKCFVTKGRPKRPLKIGIFADLVAAIPELQANRIKRFLAIYTTSKRYKLSCVPGAIRVDLHGNDAGQVSLEHAASAHRCLVQRGIDPEQFAA